MRQVAHLQSTSRPIPPPPRVPRTPAPNVFVTFAYWGSGWRAAGFGVHETGKKAPAGPHRGFGKPRNCTVSANSAFFALLGVPLSLIPFPRAQGPPLGPAGAWRAGRSASSPRPPLDRPAAPLPTPPEPLRRPVQHPDLAAVPAAPPSSRSARPGPSSWQRRSSVHWLPPLPDFDPKTAPACREPCRTCSRRCPRWICAL